MGFPTHGLRGVGDAVPTRLSRSLPAGARRDGGKSALARGGHPAERNPGYEKSPEEHPRALATTPNAAADQVVGTVSLGALGRGATAGVPPRLWLRRSIQSTTGVAMNIVE